MGIGGVADYVNKIPPELRGYGIAVYAFTFALVISFVTFWICRGSEKMQMLALGGLLQSTGAVLGIGVTILTAQSMRQNKAPKE